MRVICGLRVGTALAVCAGAGLGPAGAWAAETASRSFTTTGENQFVVPAGVTSVNVELVGGSGGPGYSEKTGAAALGGQGATAVAALSVTPGELLFVEVGGGGSPAHLGFPNEGGVGGYDGGGPGAGGEDAASGGGGGASDLRTCSTSPATPGQPTSCSGLSSLASRLLVAGGGGGGGGESTDHAAGGEGGPAGAKGAPGAVDFLSYHGGTGGDPGGPSGGGPAGIYSEEAAPAQPGLIGVGGLGGGLYGGGGGGGGGGLYGGGGGGGGEAKLKVANWDSGGGGGGGGGSSGVPAGVAGVSGFSTAPTLTQPSATIAWTLPPPAAVTGTPQAVTSTSATLTGTVNPDGSVVGNCHLSISPAPPSGGPLPCSQQVGAGSTPVAVSATVAGLSPGTTYTVTLVASSAQGTSTGSPVTFVTSASSPTGAGAALTVTNLKLTPTRFRRGKHSAKLAKHTGKGVPIGTTISFRLSTAATVTLTFQRARPGQLAGGRCLAPSAKRRRARRCKRYAAVSGGVTLAAPAGADRVRFEGVLDHGRALAPGSYRLLLTASGPTAGTSPPGHPAFTLLG